MDFDFTDEQYAIQDSVRQVLQENFDAESFKRAMNGDGLSTNLWDELTELGIFSMLVPEQFGGNGLGFVDFALVAEEFGRALLPSPVLDTIVASDVILRFGSAQQKTQLLPKIAAGQLKIVAAIAEPAAGFNLADISTAAIAGGAGWQLRGEKMLVPVADAVDLILVAAQFPKEGCLGLAMLEPRRAGSVLRKQTTLDPAANYHHVNFDAVPLSREDILGERPQRAAAQRLFDASAGCAALAITGVAGKVLDLAVAYAKERTQFGKPIGSFQAIKHKCADMAVAVESSRAAAYYGAWALAEDAKDLLKAVSIAKSFCADSGRLVCNEGIQIHGGMGFTWELGLHWYMRRAKALEYSFGDASFHRRRVLDAALHELNEEG
jgi:alkylation response protein AidB-like acyl-CoA dehydrogenase